ncbi:ABC transporter permease [Haloglycomyces albus]|uniref:ABC transporter permease n=1 Tax=Haloglycomyces albus TaxID=526067 RepID=UPI0004AD6B5B|nr:ABC transporter permease [Haloglycomyces albus]
MHKRRHEVKRRFGATFLGIVSEAVQSLRGRTIRTWLTATGIALGIAATVATVGLSSTAANAISERFDETEATTLTASFTDEMLDNGYVPEIASTERVRDIHGVERAGMYCESTDERSASRSSDGGYSRRYKVFGAEPQTLDAYGFSLLQGTTFDQGHVDRSDNVALVDKVVANDLGFSSLEGGPMVYIDGVEHAVIGIYDAPEGEAKFTGAIVVPPSGCMSADSDFSAPTVYVRTELGATDKVLETTPLAVLPEAPEKLKMSKPMDLANLRKGVEVEMQGLLLGMAAVSLVIGAVSVSNTSLVSVMERRSEIGLRRAVGAARRSVAVQFVWESMIVGLLGGLVGTVLGVNTVAIVALVRDWQIVFDAMLFLAGPLLGAVVGIVAGVYPAWRASRVAPAVTLRA